MADELNNESVSTPVVPEMATGSADNILAELFRGIKNDLNVSDSLLELAVHRFSVKVTEMSDPKKLAGAKSNFLSALKKNTMTLKTLHRGILILGARKYTITITGRRKDGAVAVASKSVKLNNKDFIEPKDDSVEGILVELFKELNHISVGSNKDFAILFDDYAELVGIPSDNISRTKERSAIKKDLLKATKISWKNFVKGMLFLGYTEFDIVLTINHRNGNNTIHSRKVILREDGI